MALRVLHGLAELNKNPSEKSEKSGIKLLSHFIPEDFRSLLQDCRTKKEGKNCPSQDVNRQKAVSRFEKSESSFCSRRMHQIIMAAFLLSIKPSQFSFTDTLMSACARTHARTHTQKERGEGFTQNRVS